MSRYHIFCLANWWGSDGVLLKLSYIYILIWSTTLFYCEKWWISDVYIDVWLFENEFYPTLLFDFAYYLPNMGIDCSNFLYIYTNPKIFYRFGTISGTTMVHGDSLNASLYKSKNGGRL